VGRNEVGITLMVDDDPSALVKPGDQSAREVTVAGYKTVIFQGRSGCTSYIVYDPDTSIVQPLQFSIGHAGIDHGHATRVRAEFTQGVDDDAVVRAVNRRLHNDVA
jgi:hypothetical protein